jgi:hypothetical protein
MFSAMGPCLFPITTPRLPLEVSHRKIRWAMSMDNVGLEICLLGTSNSMVTLTFFSLV